MSNAETIQVVGENLDLRQQVIASQAQVRNLQIAIGAAREQLLLMASRRQLLPEQKPFIQNAVDILDNAGGHDPVDDAIVVELADELREVAKQLHYESDSNAPFEAWINHLEFVLKRKLPRTREVLGKESGK